MPMAAIHYRWLGEELHQLQGRKRPPRAIILRFSMDEPEVRRLPDWVCTSRMHFSSLHSTLKRCCRFAYFPESSSTARPDMSSHSVWIFGNFTIVGNGNSLIASTFSGNGLRPSDDTLWPKKSISFLPNSHLATVIANRCSRSRSKIICKCRSIPREYSMLRTNRRCTQKQNPTLCKLRGLVVEMFALHCTARLSCMEFE